MLGLGLGPVGVLTGALASLLRLVVRSRDLGLSGALDSRASIAIIVECAVNICVPHHRRVERRESRAVDGN